MRACRVLNLLSSKKMWAAVLRTAAESGGDVIVQRFRATPSTTRLFHIATLSRASHGSLTFLESHFCLPTLIRY